MKSESERVADSWKPLFAAANPRLQCVTHQAPAFPVEANCHGFNYSILNFPLTNPYPFTITNTFQGARS